MAAMWCMAAMYRMVLSLGKSEFSAQPKMRPNEVVKKFPVSVNLSVNSL
jgi:hypothetical protein